MSVTETMQLVEKHIIRRGDERFERLDDACFRAKNVYNAANYQVRQALFAGNGRLSYVEQEKQFKAADLLPDQQLPLKVVQQVLKGLHRDWDSFAAAKAEWVAHPEKFKGCPRLPGYKHKTKGRAVLVFTAQAISKTALRQGEIVLSGLKVCVKTNRRSVDQVRVVPRGGHYVIEVVYTCPVVDNQLDETLYAGIDVGVDVVAALASNKPDFKPVLINGRPLKALNQYYNKNRAALQSQLPAGKYDSRRLQALTFARQRRIDSLLHLSSGYIVRLLVREGIGNLIIGKNDWWKQEVEMGKRGNQNFVNIPHARFIDMLSYKAKRAGIHVVLTEESYTSKCSFLDRESVQKHDSYLGKRVSRGLFRTSDGRIMQADLNGACNIIRKVVPAAFDTVSEIHLSGKRLNPGMMEKHLQKWKHDEVVGRSLRKVSSSAPGESANLQTQMSAIR